MVTDPIADMLTQIKNALMVTKGKITIPYSNIKERLALILKREGYILEVKKIEDKVKPSLEIELKYGEKDKPAMIDFERVSKPGRRVYAKADESKPVYSGLGLAILSTSGGFMTAAQAKKKRLGGEVICKIW